MAGHGFPLTYIIASLFYQYGQMLFAGLLIAVIRVKFLFHDNSHRPVLDTSINFLGYTLGRFW